MVLSPNRILPGRAALNTIAKKYIPVLAIAALLISLIAVFPAFGAGTVSFIEPSAISDANDGTLTVLTPDAQTYGRQWGEIGLFLDDDDLNEPVRRVLIPEFDATSAGNVSVKANSDQIVVPQGTLKAGDYVMIGDHTVRKVVAVTQTPMPTSVSDASKGVGVTDSLDDASTTEWWLSIPTTPVEVNALPAIVLDEYDDNASANVFVDLSNPPSFLVGGLALFADNSSQDGVLLNNTTVQDVAANATNKKVTLRGTSLTTIAASQVPNDTTYNASLLISGLIDSTSTIKRYNFIIHLVHPTEIVTLDRPFAAAETLPMHKIRTDEPFVNNVLNHADVDWENNYHLYAPAVHLIATGDNANTTSVNNFWRYRGENVVASSKVVTTNPPPTTGATANDRALNRLTGNRSGRVHESRDALIARVNTALNPPGLDTSVTHTIDDIDYEDVIFDGSFASGATKMYLIAWFHQPNYTGGAVKIRSQAYQTETTVVLKETGEESGKFSLRIKAVPFGTPKPGETSPPAGFYNEAGRLQRRAGVSRKPARHNYAVNSRLLGDADY